MKSTVFGVWKWTSSSTGAKVIMDIYSVSLEVFKLSKTLNKSPHTTFHASSTMSCFLEDIGPVLPTLDFMVSERYREAFNTYGRRTGFNTYGRPKFFNNFPIVFQ